MFEKLQAGEKTASSMQPSDLQESASCAANTTDLRSIDLQGLEHSDPIIASKKGVLVRSFCCSVYYLLKERLLALDIFW